MESIVYLLGCGCGTVDYLTVKGYELLKRADVVVFDALIDQDLLDLLPLDCEELMLENGVANLVLSSQKSIEF